MNILLTGSTGFIGGALLTRLRKDDFNVLASVRNKNASESGCVYVGGLSSTTDWDVALSDMDVVVHCAGRAHIMMDHSTDPLAEFRRVNTEGTINLARQAASAGVTRFIFLSSIGVNGNSNERPFTAQDQPSPVEPYALSKWEAEQGLWQVHNETGMEVVIIRPPLVYGAGAPGNFGSLVRWIDRGVPLPLGAIHNKRSFVGIDNLVDLIVCCVKHPAAANQLFLAGDGKDLSTTALLRTMAKAMGKSTRLFPVPTWLLQLGATLLGKKAMAKRVLGSLQVDIGHTVSTLGWKPPVSVDEGFRAAAADFLKE